MRSLLWATGVAVMLTAGAASANPLDDAKGGMKAFDKGDNSTAVRLFTSAINSHRLTRTDQELALVKRAEARVSGWARARRRLPTPTVLSIWTRPTTKPSLRAIEPRP